MLEACHDPDLAARVLQVARVSPHPTPKAELYAVAEPEMHARPGPRHLGYFGNFYANRGLTLVLDALALLPASTCETGSPSTSSPPSRPTSRSRSRGAACGEGCTRRPFVGFLDFLALTSRMDCLLVTDAVSPPAARNPFLPSKWSDYRGSGTPVWGIVEEGSALDAQPLRPPQPGGPRDRREPRAPADRLAPRP